MWLTATFDLPSGGSASAKDYRKLRKALTACGFSSVQKSVAWRWCEDLEHGKNVIAKVLKKVTHKGDLLFFLIPDASFQHTVHISNNKTLLPPDPPDPWLILA